MCSEEMQIAMRIVITILDIIKFLVPCVLIILCTIDVFKIIVTKKEDEVKKIRNGIFRKLIYAIVIYLIPFLVPLIFKIASNIIPMEYDTDWKKCYDYVNDNKNSYNLFEDYLD